MTHTDCEREISSFSIPINKQMSLCFIPFSFCPHRHRFGSSENVAAVLFSLSEIRCDSSSLFGGFSCHQFHIRAAIMVKFWDSIPDDLRDWVSRKIDDSNFCPSSHPLFLFMSKTFSRTFVGAGTASLLHGLGAPCREACQRFPKRAAVINFFHLRS